MREDVEAVQDTRHDRRQGDKEDIGEHQPVERDRQRQLLRGHREAPGERLHQERREHHPEGRHDRQERRHGVKDGGGEARHGLTVARAQVAREGRDEGRRQRPLGHQSAQHVRDAVRDDEGVGGVRGAEDRRLQAVTEIAGDPAEHRDDAHRAGRADQPAFLVHRSPGGPGSSGAGGFYVPFPARATAMPLPAPAGTTPVIG